MCFLSITLGALGVIGTGAAIMGGIGEAVGIAGTALGIAGAAMSAEQQQAALDFEAEQAEANRKIYEQQALNIQEQGEWEKRNLALKQRSELASHQASAAASGVLLNYGSNLTFQEDAAETNMLDQKQLSYDIATRAYQARLGAWQSENQANSLRAQSANAATAGMLNTAAAGVSGLGNTLSLAASGATFGEKMWGSGPTGGSLKLGRNSVNTNGTYTPMFGRNGIR